MHVDTSTRRARDTPGSARLLATGGHAPVAGSTVQPAVVPPTIASTNPNLTGWRDAPLAASPARLIWAQTEEVESGEKRQRRKETAEKREETAEKKGKDSIDSVDSVNTTVH